MLFALLTLMGFAAGWFGTSAWLRDEDDPPVALLPEPSGDAGQFLTCHGKWVPMSPPPTQSKCESCGSREWVPHAGKEVCAYCRGDRA